MIKVLEAKLLLHHQVLPILPVGARLEMAVHVGQQDNFGTFEFSFPEEQAPRFA
ncbi:MAG: hypothetical protein IH614_09365 [Desulfuromonadales bacterium]|nr:hypothetical protein [Desulfuromonadales bacterium]